MRLTGVRADRPLLTPCVLTLLALPAAVRCVEVCPFCDSVPVLCVSLGFWCLVPRASRLKVCCRFPQLLSSLLLSLCPSVCVCVFAVPCAVPCTVSLAAVAQGKSTVAAILSSRGFTVLNADAIAHRRYLERFRLCPFFPSFSLVALFTLFTLFTCG